MVNEYIRKAEAIEAVDFGITLASAINLETGEWSELFKRENDELRKAIERIQKIEPADVVQVVRCRDCKYSHMTYDGKCKYCDIWFPDEDEYMDGDYFCASAEQRKEVNE